ncbi:MAG TPA: sigma-70 family RNA polymerase sigma factor [Nannocystis exedens]|nr:sigma-70 family RNA polymerase sigma factor [Nannocystis exedens]
MSPEDDTSLAKAWAAGELGAGDTLLRRHTRGLNIFFRTKVPTDEITDLVQQTFEGCVKNIHSFSGASSFQTYLRRIAHYKLIDYYRRTKARKKNMAEFQADRDAAADIVPGLSTLFAAHGEERLLIRGLQKLPIDHQILLEHRYYEGLTAPALAELYECPEGTIRSRIRRATKQLREIIAKISADPTLTESTLADLDGWARKVHAKADQP